MLYFTVDLFIDALILLLHANNDEVRSIIRQILDIYQTETKDSTYRENEFFDLYILLIKEVMNLNITIENQPEIDAFLLKFKSNELLEKDPELYTNLKKIFTDTAPLDDERRKYLTKRLVNSILLYNNAKNVKRMFGKLASSQANTNPVGQEMVLNELSTMCSDLIKMNQDGISAVNQEEDDTLARYLDSDNKDSIKKALQVHNTVAVQNLFKTGLQGLNNSLDGGFNLGESIVFNALPHSGKATTNDTLIKIPGGWKKMGEIQIGDTVTAWDGSPSKVTGVFPQGKIPVFRVDFIDGRWLEVSGDHLWTVVHFDNERVEEVLSTKQIIAKMESEELYVPLCQSESLPEVNLPEDPYSMGIKCRHATHIPEEYLYTSHLQRLSLVRGLCGNDFSRFSTTQEQLVKDYQYLMRSFGKMCTYTKLGDTYVASVKSNSEQVLQIVSVTPLTEPQECTCISIDHPDKLYVAKDFIVTHNTLMLLKFARWLVTYNTVSNSFKNPTCIIYSLENETPQNLLLLFNEIYINKYKKVPPKDLTDDQIADFCFEEFRKNGWRLIIDRKIGANFGFPELVADFERYLAAGYTPLMCVIDYMNMMRKGHGYTGEENVGNHLLVRELYTNVCNYLKSHNCTLITAHQLNRKAAEMARLNPLGAVKRFGVDMLADSTDPQREIDCAFYQHKEQDASGRWWMTWKMDKHRYHNNTPEKYKFFCYRFQDELGIMDDIDGSNQSTDNINAVPFDEEADKERKEDEQAAAELGKINLFS